MVKLKHHLAFVTEVDETSPLGKRILALDEFTRTKMLQEILVDLIAPAVEPVLEKLNEGASATILKLDRETNA